jgi:hypothetical protein
VKYLLQIYDRGASELAAPLTADYIMAKQDGPWRLVAGQTR